MNIINKLFYLNAWTIGYRQIDNDVTDLPSADDRASYYIVPLNDFMYYADPFIFEDSKGAYLFAESMNRFRGKATISVSKYENGKFGKFKEIIREPFHMSYPNVFKLNGDYYMIPETVESGQVRLYKALDFPYKWVFCKTLLNNGNKYTDNAIEIIGDNVLFYAFFEKDNEKYTELYKIDFDTLELIQLTPNVSLHNERPAGNIFKINGNNYRPVQNCEKSYGRAINVYSHNCNKNEDFVVAIDETCYDTIIKRITGTHTFNRSEHFEVIDIKFDRFCLTRRLIWFINRINRKKSNL